MGNVTTSAHPVSQVRYLLEWMDEEEEDQGEVRSEAPLCHPLCQCPNCAPTQKVRWRPVQQRGCDAISIKLSDLPAAIGAAGGNSRRKQLQRRRFHASPRRRPPRTLAAGHPADPPRGQRERPHQPERHATSPGLPEQPHPGKQ